MKSGSPACSFVTAARARALKSGSASNRSFDALSTTASQTFQGNIGAWMHACCARCRVGLSCTQHANEMHEA